MSQHAELILLCITWVINAKPKPDSELSERVGVSDEKINGLVLRVWFKTNLITVNVQLRSLTLILYPSTNCSIGWPLITRKKKNTNTHKMHCTSEPRTVPM